jgi:membrane associated rhomboid family serine protease
MIGINVAVFCGAMYTKAQAQSGYPQPFVKFMRIMTCNLTDCLKSGAWYQMLTNTFTHLDLFHLGGNMLTAYFLGGFLCYAPLITPFRFVTIAIGSGITGSVGFLFQRYLASGKTGYDQVLGGVDGHHECGGVYGTVYEGDDLWHHSGAAVGIGGWVWFLRRVLCERQE